MSTYREHLFPLDHPRLADIRDLDAYSYADAMREHPLAGPAIKDWLALFHDTSFRGITSDGQVVAGLFDERPGEGAPTGPAIEAAEALCAALSASQVNDLCHPIDSAVWRAWMNPEFYLNRFGLRLEELDAKQRDLSLVLVRASLSDAGYTQVRHIMRANGFLGEITRLPQLLNEYSYNINLFGVPSATEPWGWNLYGHHLCLNTMFVGDQQFFTPVFMGAEPNEVGDGMESRPPLFASREALGLAFMRGLSAEKAAAATLYPRKRDPGMPDSRLHPGDELHLGGAFQDNRIIPNEGLRLADLDSTEVAALTALVEDFLAYQPNGPRTSRLCEFLEHLDDTWFCWIGGSSDDSVFYYRIQSPVLMIEFDHHAGVFLANSEPERFHIHTLVRTPNGNDYGVAVAGRRLGRELRLNGGPA